MHKIIFICSDKEKVDYKACKGVQSTLYYMYVKPSYMHTSFKEMPSNLKES